MSPTSFTPEALADRLAKLAGFSAPGPGVTRRVYDDAWCDAHLWLQAEARGLGLDPVMDAVGNLVLRDPAASHDRPALLVGSHLDTVVHGGKYDGAYGTIAGLMLAAELRGSATPVTAFVTCEEEGSRFPAALTGVRGLLGRLEVAELAGLRDEQGVTWADALTAARARGCAAAAPAGGGAGVPIVRAARQLELHIEQGPVLEAAREPLAIVDRIAGYRRLRARLTGEPRHAGTTPMDRRHDALAAAAAIVLAAETLAVQAGPPAVATAGFAHAEPGLFNVVPGACTLGLEVRHTETEALEDLARELEKRAQLIARQRGVSLVLERASAEPPTALSEELAAGAAALAQAQGIPHRRMASGAGHDTMAFAQAGVPALMLFVPSRGGISHSPDEHTSPRELWTGLAFARELLGCWAAESR